MYSNVVLKIVFEITFVKKTALKIDCLAFSMFVVALFKHCYFVMELITGIGNLCVHGWN